MTKKSILFSVILFSLFVFIGCSNEIDQNQVLEEVVEANPDTVIFDQELATRLGADDYGMKKYVMAFLKSGPNRSQDSLEASRLQRAHLDNISRMAEAGQLLVAGPFLDDGEIRGIYIFNGTMEEARKLTETDPAIKAGRLEMELRPWYGPASLGMTKEISEKITKKGI
ncbi:MAG: hypothetical protein DWQ02_01640, partial [Bacteroidetes bacterium]